MIAHVSFEGTTWADLPFKFEAGTPDFVDIAAFHRAIEYIQELGIDDIARHENELLEYTTSRLVQAVPQVDIYGTTAGKAPLISFNIPGIHHFDLGTLLDKQGVAVRTGHHCAQPLMHVLGIEGCVRASMAVYNTTEECDRFVRAVVRAKDMLL